MSADTKAIQIPEKLLRQIRDDCQRAVRNARLCPSKSQVSQLRCIDTRPETDEAFGAQLWYFDGHGIDTEGRQVPIFGALEYSLQFGIHERIDSGVFESLSQRDRFHSVYRRGLVRGSLWHPAHKWLALGMLLVALTTLIKVLPRLFPE